MRPSIFVALGCGVPLALCAGFAQAALQGRDLDGHISNGFEAYYDTALDITWLADANVFVTQLNELATAQERFTFISGIIAQKPIVAGHALTVSDFNLSADWTPGSGNLTWWAATAFASSAAVQNVNGWRLPNMLDMGGDGCNFGYVGTDCGWSSSTANNELAHMYYVDLARPPGQGPNGEQWPAYGIPNEVAMTIPGVANGWIYNLKSNSYWYGNSYVSDNNYAWSFYNTGGEQSAELKSGQFTISRAWLVRDGDIAAVPEPSMTMSLLAGLFAVGWVSRVRQQR